MTYKNIDEFRSGGRILDTKYRNLKTLNLYLINCKTFHLMT